jgi:hypothetical protein
MRGLLAGLAIVSVGSVTAGAAVLTFTETSLGGGLVAYDFTADCMGESPTPEPIWVEMRYEGYQASIHQAKYGPGVEGQIINVNAFGAIQVDKEEDANTYDPLDPGYSKMRDSWFYLTFTKYVAPPTSPVMGLSGGAPTDNYMYIDSGMPAGWYSYVELHAHIVCTGDVVLEGRIGFSNVWYPIVIPEPACTLLLVAGLGPVLWRRPHR